MKLLIEVQDPIALAEALGAVVGISENAINEAALPGFAARMLKEHCQTVEQFIHNFATAYNNGETE